MEIQLLPGHFKLWSELELHEFQHKFVIKAAESTDQGFSIRRSDGTVEPLSGLFFSVTLFAQEMREKDGES